MTHHHLSQSLLREQPAAGSEHCPVPKLLSAFTAPAPPMAEGPQRPLQVSLSLPAFPSSLLGVLSGCFSWQKAHIWFRGTLGPSGRLRVCVRATPSVSWGPAHSVRLPEPGLISCTLLPLSLSSCPLRWDSKATYSRPEGQVSANTAAPSEEPELCSPAGDEEWLE